MTKIISLQRLKEFWEYVKSYFNPKFEAIDTKIEKQVFQGTEAELEQAVKDGLVDENTLIILTDKADSPIYEFCTNEDILNLFPQYKTA